MAEEEPRRSGGDAQESQGAKDGKDADFLKEMRGYLMTVGTLFVTMAFQAALQPPAWMRTVDFLRYDQTQIYQFKHPFRGASHAAATAPAMFAPSPGPSPQTAESTTGLFARAVAYMLCNGFTFVSALSLVLLLLWDIQPALAKRTLKAARYMTVGMGISVMATIALGISAQWIYTLMAIFMMGLYAFFLVLLFKISPEVLLHHLLKRQRYIEQSSRQQSMSNPAEHE